MSNSIDYSRFDNIGATDSEDEEEEGTTLSFDVQNLPNGWLRVGHVLIHPSEREHYFYQYSKTVLTENPKTFVADPSNYKDGIVKDWGIGIAPFDEEPRNEMSMLLRTNKKLCGNTSLDVYGELEDPTNQFIKVLEHRKLVHADSVEVQSSKDMTYQLRISLCECEEDVWRLIEVPSGIAIPKLHDQVLVPVMGWSRGYHGYAFEDPKDGAVLGPKKYSGFIDMMHWPLTYSYIMDDRTIPLVALMKQKGDWIQYKYDLGDNWCHRIELVNIIEPTNPGESKTCNSNVRILDGAGACPPEDSNGLDNTSNKSYASFLKEYKLNPKSLKIMNTIRNVENSAVNYCKPWIGGTPLRFHPLKYDIDLHRYILEAMLAGPAVQKIGRNGPGAEELGLKPGGVCYKHSFRACTGCGDRIKALNRCGECAAWYCSRQCQVDDWKHHKKACKQQRKKKKAGSSAHK